LEKNKIKTFNSFPKEGVNGCPQFPPQQGERMKAIEKINTTISEKLQAVSQEAEILLREGKFLEASQGLRKLEAEISDLCWETCSTRY
jgi:NifB/MoaA-like Fe-S oxidoreductase